MNIYGCIPTSYFPSHSALTYWAQAASLAGLPSPESALTSAGFALGLKKSQLAFNINDVLQKSRSAASLRTSDDVPSSFRVATRLTPPGGTAELSHHGHLQLRLQQQQQQQQHIQHHHLHHRSFSTPPPVGNGLAPLQALCDLDVSAFTAKTTSVSGSSSSSTDSKGGLTFGMSRILSEDFGKVKTEKENSFLLSSVPESCRSLPLCPCNSASCPAYTRPQSPYPRGSLPSLSAVHALQPPNYPLSSSADALPGPYSILSTDGSSSNQPKRKRSWSRAVFSNLQRKGLEKRFEVQKYVTKPDRRQLAAMLGLTDAQVKVWFQNRRMKWRHAQQQGEKDKQIQQHGDEEQQPVAPPPKHGDLKVETENPADVIPGAKNSEARLGAPNVFAVTPDVTVKLDSNDIPLNLHGRLTSTPPRNDAHSRDVYSRDAHSRDVHSRVSSPKLPSDRRASLSAPFDTRPELSADDIRARQLNTPLYRDAPSRPHPSMTSAVSRRSRRSSSSGADDVYSDVILDYRMDSEEDGSQSGLEIDSDVDMHGDDEDDITGNQLKDYHRRHGGDREEEERLNDDVSGKDIDVDN